MRKRNNYIKLKKVVIGIILLAIVLAFEYHNINIQKYINILLASDYQVAETVNNVNINDIPDYKDNPYIIINNNIPYFEEEDYSTEEFEFYSKLDKLGRCGIAYANICKEIMPSSNEERDEIGSIKPTGWQNKKYRGIVEGNYLYNRCHLIGWQLSGENANKRNLITGTRYMNVEGMLPFENKVDDYFEEKENINNHVLYRITPIYEDDNLVATGVQMEAYSVEDHGEGVCFNVFVYNVQPGIIIDYTTGDSLLE